MKRARTVRIAALVIGVALIAAACGGSEDSADEPVIVVESATASADEESAAAVPADDDESSEPVDVESSEPVDVESASTASEEEQALEFAQCMRDEGVDFPDPTVNSDGSVDFFGGGGRRDGDGVFGDDGFEDAIEQCGELIEGASFLPSQDDQVEREDLFLEAAQCLRDEGIDVSDPDFSDGGFRGAGGPFGADFDPDDPDTAAALDACEDIFTSLGAGRGN